MRIADSRALSSGNFLSIAMIWSLLSKRCFSKVYSFPIPALTNTFKLWILRSSIRHLPFPLWLLTRINSSKLPQNEIGFSLAKHWQIPSSRNSSPSNKTCLLILYFCKSAKQFWIGFMLQCFKKVNELSLFLSFYLPYLVSNSVTVSSRVVQLIVLWALFL